MAYTIDRIQGASASLAFKAPVRCATTAAITLSGYQTIDGVLPTADDHPDLKRILVKDQDDAEENGIYEMSANGWVRTKDFDSVRDFRKGTIVFVSNGTANAGLAYRVNSAVDPDDFSVDEDDIDFAAGMLTSDSIGVTVQAWDADLDAIAALAKTDGNVIVGNGTTWVVESGNTARTSLGLGTSNSPTFVAVTVDDEAYDASGWNGDLTVPTKNAVRDALEALIAFDTDETTTPVDTDAAYFFADYDCDGVAHLLLTQSENQSGIAGGGFRDVIFVEHIDGDNVDYTAIGQKVSYAVRGFATSDDPTAAQYKDLQGGNFVAIGRIEWTARGVTGVSGDAIQYGAGIASNEFHVQNPAAATTQSVSMAAVQPILSAKKAAEDGSHKYYGVRVTQLGKRVTGAFSAISAGTDGDDGQFLYGLDLSEATIDTTGAMIIAGLSESGNVGTKILYDTGDYTDYDRAANTFQWIIGGSGEMALNASALFPVSDGGLALGVANTNEWAHLFLNNTGTIQWNNGDVSITHSANLLTMDGGGFVYNEAGADHDWRMEGDAEANLFYLDAGNDRIGIGTASPAYRLQVVTPSGNAYISSLDTASILSLFGSNGSSVGLVGTFSAHPFQIYGNSLRRIEINTAGSVITGSQAALATNATDGFLYVPTCAGTPSGTPTAVTGMAPIIVNTTNNKLYFYSGGAWRDAGP
jgi:hypothetical protein